jgi:Endonuclease/Exonuclease/phosphatase family
MKTLTRALAMSALVLSAACADAGTTGPIPSSDLVGRSTGNPRSISVMSRNLYIGFDADAAVAALATGDPAVYGPALQTAVGTLLNTDFPVRAGVIADEIARTRPHAVGLQEAWAIHADLSGLGVPMQIDLDYIDILQAALNARHLPYAVVSRVTDTDLQPLPGIQLVDREALLVDTSRLTVIVAFAQTFANNIGPIAPGIDKKAGYMRAIVMIDGLRLTVVTTHLESDLGPGSHDLIAQLRAAQAAEIVAAVDTVPNVIVVGDLNDVAGSLMYQQLTSAGLVDSWAEINPRDPGLTDTCFAPDLADATPHCQERIDFILVRGLDQPRAGLLGKEILVGLTQNERVQGPAGLLWPSDHAGVVGDFLVPPARGLRVVGR